LRGIKTDEAETLIKRALDLYPNYPFYLDSLAWLYYNKGEFAMAKQLMEIPSQLQQMPSEVAWHLAKIYLANGDKKAAQDYLNLVIKTADDPEYTRQAKELLDELNSR
jgi:FimV-like protein